MREYAIRIDNGVKIELSLEIIAEQKSEHQHIIVADNPSLGRCLLINDEIELSENSFHHIHESIVFPVLAGNPNPERVLVIGGGDGGTISKLLKYDSLKEITVVELDRCVIDLSKQYFLVYAFELVLNIMTDDGFTTWRLIIIWVLRCSR
jgi:spermidine synthase